MTTPERVSPATLHMLFLFEDLQDHQLEWVAEHGHVERYGAGAKIATEEIVKRMPSVLELSPLETSDREAELTDWLDDNGAVDAMHRCGTLTPAHRARRGATARRDRGHRSRDS